MGSKSLNKTNGSKLNNNNNENTSKSSRSKVEKKRITNENRIRFTKSMKAGLIFPVSKVEKLLREGSYGFKRLNKYAPVYFAAVIEYLVYEVLEVSLQWCQMKKKTRIVPTHINWAVENDMELSKLFKDVHIAGAGIVPQVVEYPKSKVKKNNSSSDSLSNTKSKNKNNNKNNNTQNINNNK